MSTSPAPVLRIELRKLFAAPVAQTAAVAVLLLVTGTSVGGFAAAIHSPSSDIGRKAAAMVTGVGWDGYIGLSALSLGICTLLAGGVVVAWAVGREFTEGTVVGLFAIAASRGQIAQAKLHAFLCWASGLVLILSTTLVLGGLALGLPTDGLADAWLTLLAAGISMCCSTLPIAWVSTRWRGYLPGIGATLLILVATNLASGFGAGRYIPWAVPALWATPGSDIPTAMLALPVLVGLLGAWAVHDAWKHLQLGRG